MVGHCRFESTCRPMTGAPTASAGSYFTALAIEAIRADRAFARPLEVIFESIFDDAHQAKDGKGSRTLPGAVQGFLDGLAEFIAGQCRSEPAARLTSSPKARGGPRLPRVHARMQVR